MRTQLGTLCLVIALACPVSAQGGPAGPLLGSPTEADFQAWSQQSAADRLAAYEALAPADRQLVDQHVGAWVVERCNRDLAAGDRSSFTRLGEGLNLVPAIALEPEPEAKARVVGDAFSTVIAANHVDDYDQLRTLKARASVEDASQNYPAVIGHGGGTCGELSWALSDTLGGAFRRPRADERPYPANEHAIDVEPVFGYGTWLSKNPVLDGGIPIVSSVESAVLGTAFNHAGVRLEIDGKVLACDPAWFLKSNEGKSLRGFTGSPWFLLSFDAFLDHWQGSAAWGAYITEWEDPSGRQNAALRGRFLKAPRPAQALTLAPALAVVLAPGERVTFTAPPGAQGYRWRVDGTLGVLEAANGQRAYDLNTAFTNSITYVATGVRPGAFDTVEVELKLGNGKTTLAAARATIVCGFDARVAPGEQTVERGASICVGVSGVPGHLRARDLVARWTVPGAFGLLEETTLRGSELATYTCTSALPGGGQETISCELFLAGRRVASASGSIRVVDPERDGPGTAPGGDPLGYEGSWTVTISAVGTWTYSRWFVYDAPLGGTVTAQQGSGLEPAAGTETLTTSFTLSDHELRTADGGSGSFSLDDPGNPRSDGDHGLVWVWSGRAQELRGDERLRRLAAASEAWSLTVLVKDGSSTFTPDRRHFTGTQGRLRLCPDQDIRLEGEVVNEGNAYAGRYTNWIRTFYGTQVTYTLTRTGAAR